MNLESIKNNKLLWLGRVLMIIPAFVFAMSAYMKLSGSPQALQGMAAFGFPDGIMMPLGVVELSCLIIYLIPKTSVLGAVLLTGYLGGAICTHLRAGQSFTTPLVIALIVWGSLYLREKRLHTLLPLLR
jgi:DoxX-like family